MYPWRVWASWQIPWFKHWLLEHTSHVPKPFLPTESFIKLYVRLSDLKTLTQPGQLYLLDSVSFVCTARWNGLSVVRAYRRIRFGNRRLCVLYWNPVLRQCTKVEISPFLGTCRGSFPGTGRCRQCTWYRVFSLFQAWRCAIRLTLRVRTPWWLRHQSPRQNGIRVFRFSSRTKRNRRCRQISDRCIILNLKNKRIENVGRTIRINRLKKLKCFTVASFGFKVNFDFQF